MQTVEEALDYLRMPDVSEGKYAVVPIQGDRDALSIVEAEIVRLRADLASAEAYAKTLGTALVGLTCNGSEFYSRSGDSFRVDPAACVSYVRRRQQMMHDTIKDFSRRAKAAEAALVDSTS